MLACDSYASMNSDDVNLYCINKFFKIAIVYFY